MCFVIYLLGDLSLRSCDSTADSNDISALMNKPDYKLSAVSVVLTHSSK